MARPREFDRDQALKAATDIFWSRGFEGAGMQDLTSAMGLGRQSLYGAFGNKKTLYLEALQSYSAGNIAALIQVLRKTPSPLAGLRMILMTPVTLDAEARSKGCFGINAICEFGQSDAEVSAAGMVSGMTFQNALTALIREAKSKGEVAETVDDATAAGLVQTMLSGLKVAARAGAAPEAMVKVIDLMLDGLKT